LYTKKGAPSRRARVYLVQSDRDAEEDAYDDEADRIGDGHRHVGFPQSPMDVLQGNRYRYDPY
jgi:hypothetical protein